MVAGLAHLLFKSWEPPLVPLQVSRQQKMEESFQQLFDNLTYHLNTDIVDVHNRPNHSYQHWDIVGEDIVDLTEEIDCFARNGMWYRQEYRWVDINQIIVSDVWKPKSLKDANELIQQQQDLKNVRLNLADNGKYTVIDGIHRIHALREKGYANVLAKVGNIVERHKPTLPLNAEPHYAILKRMVLLKTATTKLLSEVNHGPIVIRHETNNVFNFSIRRDNAAAHDPPPDCTVVVNEVIIDQRDDDPRDDHIIATAIIQGQAFWFAGSYKQVSYNILHHELLRDRYQQARGSF